MTAAWIAVLAVGAATIAIKGAGTLVFADRPLPRGVAAVMPLLAPALLAALVVGPAAVNSSLGWRVRCLSAAGVCVSVDG